MADRRTDVLFGQDTINDGLSTRSVTALALSIDGTVLYAATEGAGVFRLGWGGGSWVVTGACGKVSLAKYPTYKLNNKGYHIDTTEHVYQS